MDDYLPKPVTRSELERCLHRWWDPDQVTMPAEFGDPVATGEAPEPITATDLDPQLLGLPTAQAPPPATPPASTPGGVAAPPTAEPIDAPATPAQAAAATAGPPSPPRPMPPPAPPKMPGTAPMPAPAPAQAGAALRTPAPPPSAPSAPRAVAAAPASTTAPSPPPPAATSEVPKRSLAPVLDTEILDDLQAMLGEEVDRLVDIFLDDTPRLIRALENAATGPDYDGLRDAAHSLKSSSANLGALSLSAAAKRVELAAREKSLERPAVAVALIANEFARAKQQLLARRPAQQA